LTRSNRPTVRYTTKQRTPEESQHLLKQLCNCLERIQPLSELSLDVGQCQELPSPASICHHGRTLRSLLVMQASDKTQLQYSPEAVNCIVANCPLLEQLALDIPQTCLNTVKTNQTCILGCAKEDKEIKNTLRAILENIASAPRLHTLRILTTHRSQPPPSGWHKVHIQASAFLRGYMADQLLKYLCTHGSSIKVLALSPLHCPESSRPSVELCGIEQRWPHFYTVRARTIDARGFEEVMAKPLNNCIEEMAESTILKL
jgi:hypothetical protein